MVWLESFRAAAAAHYLLVQLDHAELIYDGRGYLLKMRRIIENIGVAPVIQYLIRIVVDRHPDDPTASSALYRVNPLTFKELCLTAQCNNVHMNWRVKTDHDSLKEVWLLFENNCQSFPLL